VTPHILRHTAINRLLIAGMDLKTAQTISGHKTVAMLMHYAHVLDPHVDDALSILNKPIPAAITQELHTAPEGTAGKGVTVHPISQAKSAA
jgi:hypothetical protein